MNTTPDETKLAMWLDDELKGEDLAAVEAWAAGQPEHLGAREEVRRLRALLSSAIPAAEEPPYADFFNSRVERAIRSMPVETAAPVHPRFSWRSVLMPLAACAGMAASFLLGVRSQPGLPEIDVAGAPKAIPVEPIVYTPENGVKAEWFTSMDASATVIVLNGVRAIPDEMDFSKTVSLPADGESRSSAGTLPESQDQPGS